MAPLDRAGVLCGAAASGQFTWTPEHVAQSAVCMLMSGPFLTGYTQTINDYYDREIDAINEPYRPIPSGAACIASGTVAHLKSSPHVSLVPPSSIIVRTGTTAMANKAVAR